jgi:hypothetical protein
MSDVNFVLVSDVQSDERLDTEFVEVIPGPLENQVDLVETLKPVIEEVQSAPEKVEKEVNKPSLLTRKFLMIIGGVAVSATAFPILMGMEEISRISNATECQKAQQVRTNQSSIETLQARFRALGVEPPAVSIQATSLSACGPGE